MAIIFLVWQSFYRRRRQPTRCLPCRFIRRVSDGAALINHVRLAREIFGPSPANDKRILRVANTAPQTNQPNTAARKKNVRGAFQASDKLNGLSVLVVDDVMSSGATLNEIAKTLKKAGVKTVTNFIVARAP